MKPPFAEVTNGGFFVRFQKLFRRCTGCARIVHAFHPPRITPINLFKAGLDSREKRGHASGMNMASHTPFPIGSQVAFHRTELSLILGLYGRMVAAGEWRDYGISCLKDYAVFSVFRRTAENPLYRIEKHPKLRLKQGQYSVIGLNGQVLKRGHDLKAVLRVLERKLIRAVSD